MRIGRDEIGGERPPYIVCEMGAAHNGQLDRALQIMDAAKKSGAHAIKIQAFTPETITFNGDRMEFTIRQGPWMGLTLWDLYMQCHMPREWYPALFDRADGLGLTIFASVFSREDIAWMEKMRCPAYKIASCEIVDHDLIEAIGATKKPVIFSCGGANEADLFAAVEVVVRCGTPLEQIAALHCIAEYPAPVDGMAMLRLNQMAIEYVAMEVGLSDHTIGSEAAIIATVMGASIIEKHMTLSRDDHGPDDGFASTPAEFAAMVASVQRTHNAMKFDHSVADASILELRRSLYAVKDVRPGERFTRDNVRSIRPGKGLHPKHLPIVLDRCSKVEIKAGTPMSLDFVERL